MKKNKKNRNIIKNNNSNQSKAKRMKALKRIGLLIVSFIVIYGIYHAFNIMQIKIIVYFYYAVLFISLIAFIVLNRGIDTKLPEYDELPDDWDNERKNIYLQTETKKRNIGQKFMYVIIPILITFGVDLVLMNFFENK